MKFYLLLGGTCGFLVAFASGLVSGSSLSLMMRDGAIGCLAGALLMKGFYKIQMMCIRKLVLARHKERTEGADPNVSKE
jgi:hypothetical protein